MLVKKIKHGQALLAVLLILFLSLTATPVHAVDIVDSGTCGEYLTWTLDGEGVLRISGFGYMEDYPRSGGPWTDAHLRSVILPEGLTYIGSYAFAYCEELESVAIPGSVDTIAGCAFEECTSLTGLTISDGVRAIIAYAFYGCTSLISVYLPDSVTYLDDSAFEGCTGLDSVRFSESLMTIRDYAFSNCDSLTNLSLPDSLSYIGMGAFYSCDRLTDIRIPDGVGYIGPYAFDGSEGLGDENGFFIRNGTLLSCYRSPEHAAIPAGVTAIGSGVFGSAFYDDTLKSVAIPEGVTSIGEQAFLNCGGLTDVVLPSTVREIGIGAFEGCCALSAVSIPEGVAQIECNTFYSCGSLSSISIPASVERIDNYAFGDCGSLRDVYYAGDRLSWERIEIGEYSNDALRSAALHFGGEEESFFSDVGRDAWYYGDVYSAHRQGLIDGKSETVFAPRDNLTYAEAVKLAACMHQLYTAGAVTLANGSPWYQSYVDYAKAAGIIQKDYPWSDYATRAGYIEIFARALPESALPYINFSFDVPDVSDDHPQHDAIYRLYAAGVIQGSTDDWNGVRTEHLCKPDSYITRAEVAAVLTRMMDMDKRISFD